MTQAKISSSSDTAREILEFLESGDKPGRGFNGVLGRLKRKQYTKLQADIAAHIDGSYVPDAGSDVEITEAE